MQYQNMGFLLAPTNNFFSQYSQTQDIQFLAVQQMIVEIWIGYVLLICLVSWLNRVERTGIFMNMLEYAAIRWNTLEYTGIPWNTLKLTKLG